MYTHSLWQANRGLTFTWNAFLKRDNSDILKDLKISQISGTTYDHLVIVNVVVVVIIIIVVVIIILFSSLHLQEVQ